MSKVVVDIITLPNLRKLTKLSGQKIPKNSLFDSKVISHTHARIISSSFLTEHRNLAATPLKPLFNRNPSFFDSESLNPCFSRLKPSLEVGFLKQRNQIRMKCFPRTNTDDKHRPNCDSATGSKRKHDDHNESEPPQKRRETGDKWKPGCHSSTSSHSTTKKDSKKVHLFPWGEMEALAKRVAEKFDSIELTGFSWRAVEGGGGVINNVGEEKICVEPSVREGKIKLKIELEGNVSDIADLMKNLSSK